MVPNNVSHVTTGVALEPEVRSSVEAALTEVRRALRRGDLPAGLDREGVASLADDVSKELDKSRPNNTRLRTFLFGIGTTIQANPELRGTCDVVRSAVALLGWELLPLP